jgi:uncharacterized protein (TIGR02118 family)
MPYVFVLYPQPIDVNQFKTKNLAHTALLHDKTSIPADVKPHAANKFFPNPDGSTPAYYGMFLMPFENMEALQGTTSSPGMQELAADTFRISTGRAPLIMVGS